MPSEPASIHASAPGKVVMSGEYAVLDGAPAVCMAVNRRARVTIVATDAGHHTVVAPGHVGKPARFRSTGAVLDWIDAGEPFELFQQVWRSAAPSPATGLAVTLDTAGFVDAATGRKTGIGSSAALAVALACALQELGTNDRDPVDAAHRGHRAFQKGLGSGVDIATSAAGGLVEFEMQGRTTTPLRMPAGLEWRLLWSGSPAATRKKLERLGRSGPQPSRAALAYSARRLAEAWRSGSAACLLREYRDYVQVLQEFSIDHDLGMFDAGHGELVTAAASNELVYKPCGAGGGDIGIVLSSDSGAIDEFVAGGLPANFRVMEIRLEPQGMQVTRTRA